MDGVPELNDGFESEGSRGTIYGKHMEGHFPGSSSNWKSNYLTKQIHEDVIVMQHEGHGHTGSIREHGIILETDEW